MKNRTDKTINEIFEECYKEAISSPSTYQITVLKKIIESNLEKKDWLRLEKDSIRFNKKEPAQAPENISFINNYLTVEKDSLINEDLSSYYISKEAENIIIQFTHSESIRCLLRSVLYAYDRAIYFKHHNSEATLKVSDFYAGKKLNKKYVYKFSDDLKKKSPLFETKLKATLDKELKLIAPEQEDAIDMISEKRLKLTYEHVMNHPSTIFKLPIEIPISGFKKDFENNGRNYFMKNLKVVMIALFDRERARIIATITSEIFGITVTEEDVRKL